MASPAASQTPTDWYTAVGRRLARHITGWESLSPAERLEWLTEVVARIDEGKTRITIPAAMTADGVKRVVRLADSAARCSGVGLADRDKAVA